MMMRSVLVTKPFHYEIIESEIPGSLADNEVLVRLRAVGVCGSDIHTFRGENAMARYPIILGHENAGEVVRTGAGVSRFRPGDRVVVEQIEYCGECYPCSIGSNNVCENLRVRGATLDGGFREYLVCKEKSLYALPDGVSYVEGAMVEPFTIGAQCVAAVNICREDTVLIFGGGTIGSTILQTCAAIGAKTLVADIDRDNLERAKRYGADVCLMTKNGDLAQLVGAHTDGKGVTVAVDAVGFPGSVAQLLAPGVVRNAGRVLCLGFCTQPEGLSQAMLTGRNITLHSSRLQAGKYPQVIRGFAEKRFNLDGLVTNVIPFKRIEQVFEQMISPVPSVKKMVITFD